MKESERVADLLFGRALRVDVATWILRCEQDRFYQGELVAALPDRVRSSVPQELSRLVRAGMLTEDAAVGGERRRYFRRTSSQLWDIFTAADGVIEDLRREATTNVAEASSV